MICKKCGSFIDEGSLFCGECGWDVRKPYNPEPPVDPGVNIPIESIDKDDPYSIDPNIDYYPEPDSNSKKPKGKIIALIIVLAVIVLFAVISILAFTDFVSFQNIPVLSQYESFLQGLSAEKDEEEQPKEEPVNGEESISNPVSEDNAGQKEPYSIWSPSESEQSLKKESKETKESKESKDNASQSTDSDIPDELSAYKDKLVVENRNYEITLERSNYNILFRSSPELIDVDSSDSNVISRIPDGTRIYVSYIYNGTWAVHFYKGKWGFSSLYHKNDPSSTKLMKPVD